MLLNGELDLYNAPRLEKIFNALVQKDKLSFIIDFENVKYIDSSGIGVLLKINGIAKGRDLDFILSSINGEVHNVLKLTNLIQFFPIVENYQSGVKKLLKNTRFSNGEAASDRTEN